MYPASLKPIKNLIYIKQGLDLLLEAPYKSSRVLEGVE